jgi:glycosyltransferase involved in cell wall biosynthesis
MNFLFCNTYLYRRGGAEVSLFELADLLTNRGHTVTFFGMKDPRNEVTDNSEFFVDNLEFDDYRPLRLLWGIKAARRVLHSDEAMKKVTRLLEAQRPDLVYVNNVAHHISPSILEVFKEKGLPVVLSVRDYKMICPNSLLLNRGGVCERCRGAKFYNVLLYRCKRDSLVPSAVACAEAYFHTFRRIYSLVDGFLAPSLFCREKLVQFGLDERKIWIVPNFIRTNGPAGRAPDPDSFCLYFGRLSREKGLGTLLEALGMSHRKLVIAGEGRLKSDLITKAEKLGLDNVTFMPRQDRNELSEVIGSSLFTVFPSLCYETFGRGVIESFALGRPVVVSRGGALAELVDEGVDGFLADPLDPRDLADKMDRMFSSRETSLRMGEMGRTKVMRLFNPDRHYGAFMSMVEKILDRSSS